ncbi:MAG: outer membrane protein assembly factor BamA, partial [Tabrizicola sp.]|nr:outer membrane protein assembly factor BamA [Tabrizicola sp.]
MQMTHRAAKGRSSGAKARARLLATAVFVGLATASQPFLTPVYAQAFSFSNVVVEGNQRVDNATILAYAGISRGEEVSAAVLNDAYQRIVNSGLFETVE